MTREEVSALLRRSPATLSWWRTKGRGPKSVRLGRGVVYRRSDVLAWIAEQEHAEQERRAARAAAG